MRAFLRHGFLALLFPLMLLAGCTPPGPPLGASALPPVPAGAARIFVYRQLEPYESREFARVLFNGAPAGAVGNGAVFYRDVQPGPTSITIVGTEPFPNQFKTVLLRPGETAYARIESLSAWTTCMHLSDCYPTFSVRLIDPATALGEMQALALSAG
ncbi:MAG TPA: hypothetical protein VLV50_11590 [Stellaceae bacterium]|nr:hypothetical protein [Stellaceae bacterium]